MARLISVKVLTNKDGVEIKLNGNKIGKRHYTGSVRQNLNFFASLIVLRESKLHIICLSNFMYFL